jgi:predicted RNase H-like HicB family nuclease
MKGTFTEVFEKVNDLYIGYIEELPGANTQGKTLEEAHENLREAVELILKSNKEYITKQMPGTHAIREKMKINLS